MRIGIDIHKRLEVVCEIENDGRIAKEYSFPNTDEAWNAFMSAHSADDPIALEASTSGKYAARLLRDHGFDVTMANPGKMKAIYESYKKTDRNDARILAKKLREGELPQSYLPSREIDEIRSLVRYRRSLGDEMTQIKNRVHAILARNGISILAADIFGRKSIKKIVESASRMSPADSFVIADLIGRFHDITDRIDLLQKQLASMGNQIPEVRKLMTVPGIDYYSALAIHAEIGEIGRFPDASHLSAYCGLVPRVDQSGDSTYYGHITKAGPSLLRFFMVNSVHTTVKISRTFKTTYRKLRKRVGNKKAIIAMARKLSVVIYNMLAKNKDFMDRHAFTTLYERKLERMQTEGENVQKLEVSYATGLINREVIRLQSNELLS